MINLNERIQLENLLKAGYSVPDIAGRLGRSTATIYTYKRRFEEAQVPQQPSQPSASSPKLIAFLEFLDTNIKLGNRNSSKLYNTLVTKGYKGSYHLVNEYVKHAPVARKKPYKPSKQVITDPGQQAQVDWGSFGTITINGKEERLYAFVYVLSYSRALYVEFVIHQNQKTFHECHIHAFEKLGIPQSIAYDNIKTVILSREKLADGSKKLHLNPAFIDFYQYYGFEPFVCPPYWPRSKGKVEAGVKYVRNNFMQGNIPKKEFISLEALNARVAQWVATVANARIHGTTKEKPHDRWLFEKDFLTFSTNIPPFETAPLTQRYSNKDNLVNYKSCFYSVPNGYGRKKLDIRDISKHGVQIVEIYYLGDRIATHTMSHERGRWVIDYTHVIKPDRKQVRRLLKTQRKPYVYKRPRIKAAVRDLKFYSSLLKKIYGKKKN